MTLCMMYGEGRAVPVLLGVRCNGELDEEELGGTRVFKDTHECCEDDYVNNNT